MKSSLKLRGRSPPSPKLSPPSRYKGMAEKPQRLARRASNASPITARPSSMKIKDTLVASLMHPLKHKLGWVLEELCPCQALAWSENVQAALIPLIWFRRISVRFVFGAVSCRESLGQIGIGF